jgi:hypothetical protein
MKRRAIVSLVGLTCLLCLLTGCAATLQTGRVAMTVDSIPEGVLHHDISVPGIDANWRFDPWLGIEKLVEWLRELGAVPTPGGP